MGGRSGGGRGSGRQGWSGWWKVGVAVGGGGLRRSDER